MFSTKYFHGTIAFGLFVSATCFSAHAAEWSKSLYETGQAPTREAAIAQATETANIRAKQEYSWFKESDSELEVVKCTNIKGTGYGHYKDDSVLCTVKLQYGDIVGGTKTAKKTIPPKKTTPDSASKILEPTLPQPKLYTYELTWTFEGDPLGFDSEEAARKSAQTEARNFSPFRSQDVFREAKPGVMACRIRNDNRGRPHHACKLSVTYSIVSYAKKPNGKNSAKKHGGDIAR